MGAVQEGWHYVQQKCSKCGEMKDDGWKHPNGNYYCGRCGAVAL
eukprot:NODE_7041_length_270_cov_94.556561_g6428_i0.p2 GENE.NODE_7041_length_270_cov_94.556561_g6428_i0~~NODE_7041_length_270_cov_94.556561_g6428_i0.p2  ORF type:complete len:54 (-),score=26.40 NODE_7041_length_270_cov_94.556561_g6428_i0:109-240(-)